MLALHTLVINSLDEQIAVIDHAGIILDCNRAWKEFGRQNGASANFNCVGSSYLNVLMAAVASGDPSAGEAARGIGDVLSGQRPTFYLEYPCHSLEEKRWFIMRVTRPQGDPRGLCVVSHQNITLRKLAEERAQQMALHDPLTGLANRRYFDLFYATEMRRSARNHQAISLIEFDVDQFKEYNDEFGHQAGDQCLVGVAKALVRFSRRPTDLAARLGGDEFALVLGAVDIARAQIVAEGIRKAIDDLGLVFGEGKQITVSVGVASLTASEHSSPDQLMLEADQAMYRAKSAGRNRVVSS